ncbi:hypothetical protein NXY56_000355 [Leishmania guyanensis]
MSTSTSGILIRTTRVSSATARPNRRRAWPIATSANTTYDPATASFHYRPPSEDSPTAAAKATAPAQQAASQHALSPRHSPSTASAAPSAAQGRSASHNHRIPFHTVPPSSGGLVLPPIAAAAAQRGCSPLQSLSSRTETAESNQQQHHLQPAPPQAPSPFVSRNRQLTLSPSPPYAPHTGSSGRRSTELKMALLRRESTSSQRHGSPAPSSQNTPNCSASAAVPSSSLSQHPHVSSDVSALMHGSHNRPSAPVTPYEVQNSPSAARAGSGHVRFVARATSSRSQRQPPPTSQHAPNSQTQQPAVYLESMLPIPATRPASQSQPHLQLYAALHQHTLSRPVTLPVWKRGNTRNSATAVASRHCSSPPAMLPTGMSSAAVYTKPPSSSQPQQRVQRSYSSTAQPAGAPPRGTVQNDIYPAMAANGTGSGAREASSTRSTRACQVFRGTPLSGSGIPVGSLYGAIRTYAAVVPHNRFNVSSRRGAPSASARHPPPSAPAEAAQQQHSPRYPPNNSQSATNHHGLGLRTCSPHHRGRCQSIHFTPKS